MKFKFEIDWYNWNIGVAICRSKVNTHWCYILTILCLGILIKPFDRI